LILLFFLTFITYLDRITISLVGVRIKEAFHLSNEQFGWVVGAFALAYAIFEIPSGMLGDRLGQRKVLVRIVLWWSFFTALTGLTFGFYSLILTRFLFGMGEAGAYPNGTAVVCRWFPRLETSRAMSLLFVGQTAGAAIAPLLVVPIAISFGWRAPFFINGLIGLIWVFVCIRWFHDEPSSMRNISKEEVRLIEDNRRFIRHNTKFPWNKVARRKWIWAMIFAFFTSQWALYFFVAWMPVYLQQGRHFSENAMKGFVSALFLLGIAGALCSGWMGDWLVRKKGLVFSRRLIGTIGLAGMSTIFLIAATTNSAQISAYSLVLGGFFIVGFGNVAFSACADVAGEHTGTMAGIMNFAGQIGAFILSISFGSIVDRLKSFNSPLLLISVMLGLGAVCWLFIRPDQKLEHG
jgi:MFS family permease